MTDKSVEQPSESPQDDPEESSQPWPACLIKAGVARHLESLFGSLRRSGDFQRGEEWAALGLGDSQTDKVKARTARWLRSELAKLRNQERASLQRADIADLAVTMLEAVSGPHEDLVRLIEELLDVDRHRSKIVTNPSEAFITAARMDAEVAAVGRALGVNELARAISVGRSTVSEWRRMQSYRDLVSLYQLVLSKEFDDRVDEFRARHAHETEDYAFDSVVREVVDWECVKRMAWAAVDEIQQIYERHEWSEDDGYAQFQEVSEKCKHVQPRLDVVDEFRMQFVWMIYPLREAWRSGPVLSAAGEAAADPQARRLRPPKIRLTYHPLTTEGVRAIFLTRTGCSTGFPAPNK